MKHDVNESGSSHGTKPFVCACVGVCQKQRRRSFGGDVVLLGSSFVVVALGAGIERKLFWRVFRFFCFAPKIFARQNLKFWATWPYMMDRINCYGLALASTLPVNPACMKSAEYCTQFVIALHITRRHNALDCSVIWWCPRER